MLSKHGFFDLTVQAKGDIDIDEHHTVEDVGIVMGKALHQALGEKAGIKRFGFASAPLDETLAQVSGSQRPAYLRLQRGILRIGRSKPSTSASSRTSFGFRHPRWLESPCESHIRPQPAPHHGSHLQSVGQSPRSGDNVGRAVGGESAIDEGDAVRRDRSKRSLRDWAGRNQAISPFFFGFSRSAKWDRWGRAWAGRHLGTRSRSRT